MLSGVRRRISAWRAEVTPYRDSHVPDELSEAAGARYPGVNSHCI